MLTKANKDVHAGRNTRARLAPLPLCQSESQVQLPLHGAIQPRRGPISAWPPNNRRPMLHNGHISAAAGQLTGWLIILQRMSSRVTAGTIYCHLPTLHICITAFSCLDFHTSSQNHDGHAQTDVTQQFNKPRCPVWKLSLSAEAITIAPELAEEDGALARHVRAVGPRGGLARLRPCCCIETNIARCDLLERQSSRVGGYLRGFLSAQGYGTPHSAGMPSPCD